MRHRSLWAGGDPKRSPNGTTAALAIRHIEMVCPQGTARELNHTHPPLWTTDTIAGPAILALFKRIIAPDLKLPLAGDQYRTLVASETLGGITGIAESMIKSLYGIVQQGADDLLRDGWGSVANGIVRLAVFLRDLNECHRGGIGIGNNSLGTLVVGVLDSASFLMYTDRVVVEFLKTKFAMATATNAPSANMYLNLLGGFEILLGQAVTSIQVWVRDHVRIPPSLALSRRY